MQDVFEEIKTLVQEHIGNVKLKLDRNTRLYRGLRIDGDDAFDLLKAFSQKFNVDMAGFNLNEYFAPEGIDLIGAIANLFRGRPKPKLKELTLGDLERAAIERKWAE